MPSRIFTMRAQSTPGSRAAPVIRDPGGWPLALDTVAPPNPSLMAVREITTLGDPVLRESARGVDADELHTSAVQGLIDERR